MTKTLNHTGVKAVYDPVTKKITYQPVKSIQGDVIKKVKVNRVGGYMNVYTSADDPDLHGEWFSKATDFKEEMGWSMVGKPILINHAMDDVFKSMSVGIFDFETEDDIGRYVEGQLYDLQDYEEMLKKMRQKGKIDWDDKTINQKALLAYKTVQAYYATNKAHWSSGALPQSVVVDATNGHIDEWARIEGSSTFTPAEPDGTEVVIKGVVPNYEYSLKSAFAELDALLVSSNSIPTATAHEEPIIEAKGAKADSVERGDENTHSNDDNETSKGDDMDENMIRQIVRMVLEENGKMDGEAVIEEEDLLKAVTDDMPEETKADGDDEENKMDEEEVAKAVASKALEIIDARLAKRAKALEVARGVSRKHAQAAPVADSAFLPSATGLKGSNGNGALQIRDITPYDNWQPADFSFAADVARQARSMNRPIIDDRIVNKAFMNRFADKAIKAHQSGSVTLNNAAIKAINAIKSDELDYSTQTGYGDEWVFTGWRDQIWDTPRLDLVYTQLQVEDMPSNPYDVPVESTDPSVFFVSETADEDQLGRNDANAAIPDTKIATNKVQLNAKKHALRVNWSAELNEDAIAGAIPKFRNQAQRAVEDALELSVLLGDTSSSTNINYDGGTAPATASYMAYDGLFHQALVTSTANAVDAGGNAPTLAHIRSVRSKLGNAQGFNPNNLAIFTDYPTYMKLLSIDAVVTQDKFGDLATVKTGSLGMIDGMNIFVSGQMNLAASDGKITFNAAGTLGRLMIVSLPEWYRGFRRRIASHVEYLPFVDAWEMTLTVRHALAARSYSSGGAQQSGDDSVAVLYNIGV